MQSLVVVKNVFTITLKIFAIMHLNNLYSTAY